MTNPEQRKAPVLPEGYPTWLDYAIATFDVRSVQLAGMFDDDDDGAAPPTYEAIRQAARDELNTLRAGKPAAEKP
jgi:hypothetical protein